MRILCFALFILFLLSTSCGRMNNTSVFYAPERGVVSLDHQVKARNGEEELIRFTGIQQIEVQQEGGKTVYEVWYAKRWNYWSDIELFLIPVGTGMLLKYSLDQSFVSSLRFNWWIILIGIIDKTGGKLVNKRVEIQPKPYPKFTSVRSHLQLVGLSIDEKGTFHHYQSDRAYHKQKPKEIETYDFTQTFGHDSVYQCLNSFYNELGISSKNEITGYTDYQLYASIVNSRKQEVKINRDYSWKSIDLEIHYLLLDNEGQYILDTLIRSSSGQFLNRYPDAYCIKDALDYSTLELTHLPQIKRCINQPTVPTSPAKLGEQKGNLSFDYAQFDGTICKLHLPEGIVPVIPIDSLGHYAVPQQALSPFNPILITTPENDTLDLLSLVYQSFDHNYAILKLDSKPTYYFGKATTSENTKLFQRVYALGFHQNLGILKQTEGKINALRTENATPIFQMDIHTNDLLFPAILSEQGELLGFATAKTKAYQVDGIAFFRPI